MTTIYFTNTEKVPGQAGFTRLLSKVPEVIREKILRYSSYQDQVNSLIGKLLIIDYLARHTSADINLKDLAYTEHGRPYILNSFDFNISHSGDMVVFSAITCAQVGVDIEQIKPADFNLMRDQFTTREWYKVVNNGGALADFYRIWVRKEALLKASGLGLTIPLDQIDTSGDTISLDGTDWHLQDVQIADGYMTAIATSVKDPEIEIMKINLDHWTK